MIHTITTPPDAHMAPLMRAYEAAVAARRRQLLLGLAVAILAFALALFCIVVVGIVYVAKYKVSWLSALTRKRGNLDRAHSAFFGRLAFCERSASRSR